MSSAGMNSGRNASFEARLARIKASDSYVEVAPLEARPDPVAARKADVDRRIGWELLGYPGAALTGLICGYLVLVLSMPKAEAFSQPLDNQNLFGEMLSVSLVFGTTLTMALGLPPAIAFVLGWRGVGHLVIACLAGLLSYRSSQVVVDYCLDWVLVVPPRWVLNLLS